MMAKYFLLVLAFTTTFVILVHSQSPHVSLSSYRYDPNSIPQNEKILQLFLRLASQTAAKVYLLKQKTLEQQLHNLKESENIAEASKSDLNVKNMIETFLRPSSDSMTPASNPLPSPRRNNNSVDNTTPVVLNENSTISLHFYHTQNPAFQNNIQSSGIVSASAEINTDSKEIPEAAGRYLEVKNRLMVDYDKDHKASQPVGQNLQNSVPISPRINSGTDSESLNQNGSNLNNGESSNNQKNSIPNNQQSSNSNNQQSSDSNNQQNSNSNSSGSNQMGQDPGSIITSMFNPATFASMIPMNMVSNVPVIGSGLAGPINMAQEALSKFGSFAPQLRSLPEIENEINAPAQENLKEENETNRNSFENPTTIENNYSSSENISVTEEASSIDPKETNNTEDKTAESTLSFDNETTTNNNNLDEVSSNETKSSLSEQNSMTTNSLKEENKKVDKIKVKMQDGKVEELDLHKENYEQNENNNYGGEDQRVKLKRLTIQVMKALQYMQDEIDHKDNHKELVSFSDLNIPTLNPVNINPLFRPKDSVANLEESVQKIQTRNVKAPLIGGENIYYNHAPIGDTQ